MRHSVTILLAGMMLVLGGCAVLADRDLTTKELRCEYRVNPLGIDVLKPRLSWVMESSNRGRMQSAYRILAASGEEDLNRNLGNLWDSGKVRSDQSNQVVYEGKPLKSRMQCFWKVRVWDKNGSASAWSEPAVWTVGLLEPQDQQAKWIGYDAPAAAKEDKSDVLSIDKCSWVWFPEGEPEKSAPIGTRFFRHKVNIADIAAESAVKGKVKRASFRLLADNEATVFVNGREAGKVAGWSPGQVLDITDKLTGGINTLSIAAANEGDNPNPAGLAGKLVIEFEEAKTRAIPIDHSWKTSNSEQENWKSADFNDSSWVYAKETVYVQRSTSNVQRSTFGERWTSQRLFYRRRLICARPFRLKSR